VLAVSIVDMLCRLWWRLEAFLAKGPAYWYVYGRWRFLNWWYRAGNPYLSRSLDNATLLDALDLRNKDLSAIKQAVAERNLTQAQRDLVEHFGTRTHPRFHFTLADRSAILPIIRNDWREATIGAADQTCRNSFCFRHLGPIRFEGGVNWSFCPQDNIDWTWDLNRHAYFNTLGKAYWYTGDEKYRQKVRSNCCWIG